MNLEGILKEDQKKAVFYGRHSTEDQTIDTQLQVCETFADKHGLLITEHYIDEAISAFKKPLNKRENLERLRKDARNKEFYCVIVYKADRLARTIKQHITLWNEFRELGIPIILAESEKLYTTDSPHEIIVEIGISSLESENTRVRTSDHYRMKTQKGIWLGGKLPYGYQYEDDPNGGEQKLICQIPYKISIVKEVFRLYQEGYGFQRVAQLIGAEHPDEKWGKEKIKSIITNPFYAGYTTSQRISHKSGNTVQPREEWVMGECDKIPPCIELDIWESCMEIYEKKRNGSGHPNRYVTPFLFRDILVCSECETTLITKNYKSGKKKKDGSSYKAHLYYICPTCHHKWDEEDIHKNLIEEVLDGWFYQYKSQSQQALQSTIMQKIGDDIDEIDSDIASLKKEIQKQEALLKEIEQAQKENMKISVELDTFQKALIQSRISLNKKIESLTTSAENKERDKQNLLIAYGDETKFKEFIQKHTDIAGYSFDQPIFRKLLFFLFDRIDLNKDGTFEFHAVVDLTQRGPIYLGF